MKKLSKILSIFLCLAMLIGFVSMVPTHAHAEDYTATFDATEQGYENAQEFTSYTNGNISFIATNDTRSNAPAYYTSGNALRFYASDKFTIKAAAGYVIKSVKVTGSSLSPDVNDPQVSITGGTFSESIITPANANTTEIVITNIKSSGNFRIKKCEVTYSEAAACTEDHTTQTTKYVSDGVSGHHKVYTCCNAEVANSSEEHSLKFASNRVEHWKKCDNCDYTTAKSFHSFTSGVCECGAKDHTTTPLADGDKVYFYFAASEFGMSTTVIENDRGNTLAGVATSVIDNTLVAAENLAEVLVSLDAENGYYTFTVGGKYLTSGATGNALTLETEASDNSKWTIEFKTLDKPEDGYIIRNVNAAYNGYAQCIEYYSKFTTFSLKGDSNLADFTIHFYDAHTCNFVWAKDEENHYQECTICGYKINLCEEGELTWVTSDATNHWMACDKCDAKISEGAHDYDYIISGDTKHCQLCSVCSKQTDAEDCADGDDADELCDKCGNNLACNHEWEKKSDATNHWEECKHCQTTKDTAAHTKVWTADTTGHYWSCTCGFTTKDTLCTKNPLKFDKDNHWNQCDCGYTTAKEAHTYGTDNKCTVCGTEKVTAQTGTISKDDYTEKTQYETGTAETRGDVTFTFTGCALRDDNIRVYKGQTLMISVPTGYKITKITFEDVDGNDMATNGTVVGGTLGDGEITNITGNVTITAENMQLRFTSITVTYEPGSYGSSDGTGSGSADSGNTGSSSTDSGNTGSGSTDSGNTGSGSTDSGNTGSGSTDSGNTGSGSTDSGNTGSGETTKPAGIADGTYIIYNPAHGMALSTDYAGTYYNQGVAVTEKDGVLSGFTAAEVWTVKNNADGTITISCSGGVLSQSTFSSMGMDLENNTWVLESAGNGLYYVKNAGTEKYMEWYAEKNNWSTYYINDDTDTSLFALQFCPVNADGTTAEIPTTGDSIAVVFALLVVSLMGTAALLKKKEF